MHEIHQKLDEILHRLKRIEEKENYIMSLETDALDRLEAATAAIDGAEQSAEASFTALAQLIASLKTNTTDPATAARITAAADALNARASRLAAAVASAPTA